MKLEDYKTVLYRQEDGSWVAEIPAISGCYALMPTREEALVGLYEVFEMIATEYREKGLPLPADTTAREFQRIARELGFSKTRQTGGHETILTVAP